ncbi:2-oxo-4-hydroxy-4-carboxy-5-ureidoimidazoline decarboxylase [Ramlibacter rhizophilus]|nr:2-oxo-4-hydroxy-4-carboxy-5-ureidoimidazoline decarboxylase [Ramlibacter rhizophilus]
MTDRQAPCIPLAALLAQGEGAFVARLGGVVEHSPWVAQRAWMRGPFGSWKSVYEAMAGTIFQATRQEQVALLRAHPELAGREATAGAMTPDSNAEQGRLGLLALAPGQMARLTALNARYRGRFGYPFVVALRLHASLESVFQSLEERLAHDASAELTTALQQVCEVMRGRLLALAGTLDD